MRTGPVELTTTLTMTHCSDSLPETNRRSTAQNPVITTKACRRPVIKTHTQRQTTGRKNVLDLGKLLLAKVSRLQQPHAGGLDKIGYIGNVFSLDSVSVRHGEFQNINR